MAPSLATRAKGALRALLLQRLRWPAAYAALVAVENALLGRRLRLDACAACQLGCPSCSTAHAKDDWRRHHDRVIGKGSLRAADFERFLRRTGRVRALEISSWGEIFLNRELPEILRIAHERGIAVHASNGVNLNTASEEALEAVVRHRVRHLSVSIDGASQPTYARYRVHGDLARVLAHVDTINRHKRAQGTELPRLTWQFIVFGHNEHELAAAQAMAAERGMDFHPIVNLEPETSPVRDPDAVARQTGLPSPPSMAQALSGVADTFGWCAQMWDAPQVNWDGKLLGCCFNDIADFGNAFEAGLGPLLRSERYRYARRMLVGRAPPRADIPCTTCPLYRGAPAGAGTP